MAEPNPIRVAYLEDDPGIARLVQKALKRAGFEVDLARDGEAGLEMISGSSYDALAVDQTMPNCDGLTVLRRLVSRGPLPPTIMVTGTGDERIAVEAMKLGASDYVVKDVDGGFIDLLPALIKRAVEHQRLIEEKRRATKQIKKNHDDFLSILNMLRLGVVTVDPSGHIMFLNKAAQDLMGKGDEDVVAKHWKDVFTVRASDQTEFGEMVSRNTHSSNRYQAEVESHTGRRYWMDIEVQDDPRHADRKIFFLYDRTEVYDLRSQLNKTAKFHDLVGRSKPMQDTYHRIKDVSTVDWTVLIEGETGTGKELVARAIHSCSHRTKKPFIAVNCAGLSESMLNSQLFGHRRGAFTGAIDHHKGYFEAAQGGTLLLDEIGDISMNVQTNLLRVLEEKEINRLGESQARKVDVRVLAATNRDLSKEVELGRFRSDLLYRIRVARIELPPLRERREDIPLLCETFLRKSRAATGKQVEAVSNEAMKFLLRFDWPGNVRELRSAVDFATLHCRGAMIGPEDLPPEIGASSSLPSPPDVIFEDEKERVLAALKSAGGNRTAAAKKLGVSRATFYRHLSKLGLGRNR